MGTSNHRLSKVVRHTLSEEQTLLKNEDMFLLKSGKKAEQRKKWQPWCRTLGEQTR